MSATSIVVALALSGAGAGSDPHAVQVPVVLGQTVAVSLVGAASSVAEPAGSAPVTVRLTTSDGQPTTVISSVDYATGGGTATGGSDYTAASGTLTFPGGTPTNTTQAVNVSLTNDAAAEANETFDFTLSSPSGAGLGSPSSHTVTILDDDSGTGFYIVTACRVLDTRGAIGPTGGPALSDSVVRNFPVAGSCSVPADAVAVAINLTVTSGTGHCTIFPANAPVPTTSVINLAPRPRANNAIVPIGQGGQLAIRCTITGGFPPIVHAIVDVVGYFR